MPTKPATICTKPGCPGLVRDGVCSRCGPRKKKAWQHKPGYPRKGSTRAWRKLRAVKLAEVDGLCERCAAEGFDVPATEVHHLDGIKGGVMTSTDRLQALCGQCHAKVTGAEVMGMIPAALQAEYEQWRHACAGPYPKYEHMQPQWRGSAEEWRGAAARGLARHKASQICEVCGRKPQPNGWCPGCGGAQELIRKGRR